MFQTINKLLSQALSALNSFIAILIIVVSVFSTYSESNNFAYALVVGVPVGVIIAIFICGILAVLLDIRDEIIRANKSLDELKKE